MRRLLLILLVGCGQPTPLALPLPDPPSTDNGTGPGPTLMSQTKSGYQLINRRVRVVISPTTGDVVDWGAVDGPGVLTTTAVMSNLPQLSTLGHVEARDDQTWQFITDAPGLRWRKIYCLHGDHLFVSLIVQNTSDFAMTGAIELRGVTADLVSHDAEHAVTPRWSIHGFDVDHGQPKPADGVLVYSDRFTFAPDERHALTTDWQLEEAKK